MKKGKLKPNDRQETRLKMSEKTVESKKAYNRKKLPPITEEED
jgi:hypothetical protein